jgi:hypothetical protein
MVGEGFAESVAVVLLAELGENGKDEAAAAELEPEVLEDGLESFAHTVLYTLYDTQYVPSSTFWMIFCAKARDGRCEHGIEADAAEPSSRRHLRTA